MTDPDRTIDPQHAEELSDGGTTAGPWTLIADIRRSSGRWREQRRMILRRDDGTHWGLDYACGLTEYQDHDLPWLAAGSGYALVDTRIPLVRLYPHTVTRVEYRTTPEGDR